MFGRAERRLIRILGHIEYKLDDTSVVLPAQYNPQASDCAAAGADIQMRCDEAKELLRATLAEATAQRRWFVAVCHCARHFLPPRLLRLAEGVRLHRFRAKLKPSVWLMRPLPIGSVHHQNVALLHA